MTFCLKMSTLSNNNSTCSTSTLTKCNSQLTNNIINVATILLMIQLSSLTLLMRLNGNLMLFQKRSLQRRTQIDKKPSCHGMMIQNHRNNIQSRDLKEDSVIVMLQQSEPPSVEGMRRKQCCMIHMKHLILMSTMPPTNHPLIRGTTEMT